MIAKRGFGFPVGVSESNTPHEQTSDAMKWLMTWINFKKDYVKRPTVIFDIDDTLVTGETLIDAVVNVFTMCQKNRVSCHIVTARPESERNRMLTLTMLDNLGIKGFKEMYMMPPTRHRVTRGEIAEFKRSARERVAKRYSIVANIGDMWTDFIPHPFPREVASLSRISSATVTVFFLPWEDCPCVKLCERVRQNVESQNHVHT
jgi:hypothetical protein